MDIKEAMLDAWDRKNRLRAQWHAADAAHAYEAWRAWRKARSTYYAINAMYLKSRGI